jgi:hypothetical protein
VPNGPAILIRLAVFSLHTDGNLSPSQERGITMPGKVVPFLRVCYSSLPDIEANRTRFKREYRERANKQQGNMRHSSIRGIRVEVLSGSECYSAPHQIWKR